MSGDHEQPTASELILSVEHALFAGAPMDEQNRRIWREKLSTALALLGNEEHEAACARFVDDAAAFIRFTVEQASSWSKVSEAITNTLSHDIGGLARGEQCFSPRVEGYAKREREGRLS
jgi:hypothetical protein